MPIVCILLLLGILARALWLDSQRTRELEMQAENALAETKHPTIQWNGETYQLKEDISTCLVIGIDDTGEDADERYNHQYQADFLALVIADKNEKSCRILQLNRDTICEVPTLALDGRVMGSSREQLALAHSYGSGKTDSCRNTVNAVEKLLYGIDIDNYVRLRVSSIGKLNDAVGGVEVTLLEDFSQYDETMTEGITLTLNQKQAELFVRARKGMEEPTNLARMERQRRYMQSWVQAARRVLSERNKSPYELMEPVADELFSDLTLYQLSDLADTLQRYSIQEIQTVEGEAIAGERFMEFYPDEEQLQQLVIQLFYEPITKGGA